VWLRCTLGIALALTATMVSGCSPTYKPSASSLPSIRQSSGAGTSANDVGCSTAGASGPSLTHVRTAMTAVPGSPFGVVTTANGRWSFVSTSSSGVTSSTGLIVVLANRASSSIIDFQVPITGMPLGEALTNDGRYLLVADDTGIVVLDTARLESGGDSAVGTLREVVGGGAIEVAVSPNDRFAFVTLEDSAEIAVFNLAQALPDGFGLQDFVGMIPLGLAPVGMAVSPNGQWLYVTSEGPVQGHGTLSVINLSEAETDPGDSVVSSVIAGCSPVRVIVSSNGQTVWVTARGSDDLLGFSASSLVSDPSHALVADVEIGPAPVGLSIVSNGTRIVVADSNRFGTAGSANLAVVDTEAALARKSALLGYVPAGLFPREMALHGNELLVTNYSSGQLEALETNTLP